MRLVNKPRNVWRHYSTIALGMAGSLQGAWAALPVEVKTDLPTSIGSAVAWITFAITVLGIGGKFVDQTPKEAE